MNYKTADKLLQGRNYSSRKVGNNTYLKRREDHIAVLLHATDIISYYPDGRIVLNSGGWQTVTTKARMNEHLDDFWVWQEKRIWYVSPRGQGYNKQVAFLYKDGLTIEANRQTIRGAGQNPKNLKQLQKDVAKYVKGYMAALQKGELPAPSGGDCWYCCLHGEDGQTMGDFSHDRGDHIRQHIKEAYYVPSMIKNAADEFGVSIAARQWLYGKWGLCQDMVGYWEDIAIRQLSSALSRYILRRLGLAA